MADRRRRREPGKRQSVPSGDANLDGTVDGLDFIEWNAHKFTNTAAWCSGDFNADGIVDGQDFVAWNMNKFTSADNGPAAIPEPTGGLLLLLLAVACSRQSCGHGPSGQGTPSLPRSGRRSSRNRLFPM